MKILRKHSKASLGDQRFLAGVIPSRVLKDESDLVIWAKQEWSDQELRNQEFGAVRELPSGAVKLEFALSNREPVKEFIWGEFEAAHSEKLTLAAPWAIGWQP